MSHHFDAPETLDIIDAHCFAGAGDEHGPSTVFGINSSPGTGVAWTPADLYELRIDTDGDYAEDITYRATFPIAADGTQHVQVVELRGAEAGNRDAKGRVITPPNAPIGEVVECRDGIKLFTGQRRDPFRNFIPFPVATTTALSNGTFPGYDALRPASDSFLNNTIRSYVLEIPIAVTGERKLHFWGTTAYYDTGHNTWVQTQRAGLPNMTTFFLFNTGSAQVTDYNATAPTIDLVGRPHHPATDPASGIWGQVRDNIAAVVEAGKTYGDHPHSFPTARAYGAWAADALLPNVVTFRPGTVADWNPWHGLRNGKGIVEDIASNVIKMVVNQDFESGLAVGPVLDCFPYLAPPPPAS